MTSIERVLAAGDVRSPLEPTPGDGEDLDPLARAADARMPAARHSGPGPVGAPA